MMRRMVMVSSMMNRIEMIMMMLVVHIYFSGGGSCDGGFNFGCNYVHYKTMRMTMILMVHVFTSVVVVVVTVVPQLLHTVVTGSLSYTTLE